MSGLCFRVIILFLILSAPILSQNPGDSLLYPKKYFTIKGGVGCYVTNKEISSGSYPISLKLSDEVYGYTLNRKSGISPYISLGYTTKEFYNMEGFFGFSYFTSAQSFTYYSDVYSYDSITAPILRKNEVHGSGWAEFKYIRFEFSPTYQIKNTKLNFGVLNFDFIIPKQTNNEFTLNHYDVIPHKTIPISLSEFQSIDSIKTLTSTESVNFNKYPLKPRLNFAFSFGVEQEVNYKNHLLIFGLKTLFFKTVFISAYTGILTQGKNQKKRLQN